MTAVRITSNRWGLKTERKSESQLVIDRANPIGFAQTPRKPVEGARTDG